MIRMSAAAFSSLLRSCTPLCAIRPGKQIHAHLLLTGFLPDVTLHTDLLLLYSRCSDVGTARRVFDEMPHRNMHSWNILISAYVQASLYLDALRLLVMLLERGIRPDHFTLPSVFRACGETGDLLLGTALHCWGVRLGLEDHSVVGGSLLDMYAKNGRVGEAFKVFARLPGRDAVSWNSMISGFAKSGLSSRALGLFRRMQVEGMEMDLRAIPSALSACGRGGYLMKGREIHGKLIRTLLFKSDMAIGNSLIDMYGRCGCVHDSHGVFEQMPDRNLVTWTAMISCYGVHGMGVESLCLYERMIAEDLKPNCVTFTSVLASCSHSGFVNRGRAIFESMTTKYNVEPQAEHYACMVDLLGRFGNLREATELIRTMSMEPTASVWGALLGACVVHKNIEIAKSAAHKLFDLEPGNPSNYIALCGVYDSVGMRDDLSRARSRMREVGLVKTPGCSWIALHGRVHSFVQGDAGHLLSADIYATLQGLLELMVLAHDVEDYE